MNRSSKTGIGVRGFAVLGAMVSLVAGCSGKPASPNSSSATVAPTTSAAPVIPMDKVVEAITQQANQWAGRPPESVTCPHDLQGVAGARLDCELKDQGTTWGVVLTVTSVVGDKVNFEIVETVRAETVANQLADEIGQKVGRQVDVVCPGDLPGRVGAILRCHVTDQGQTWGLTVNVTKAEGTDITWDFNVDAQPGS